VALNVLYHVDTRKAFSDLQLNRALKTGALETRDVALVTEIVNGSIRWRGRLDWILVKYVAAGIDTLSPWVLNILRMGLYQILFLDRIPPHAAVDESVKLAKRYGHSGAAGLVNAVLRRVLRERASLADPEDVIDDPVRALAAAYSHPEWLVERWLERFGPEETRELLMADNLAPPMGLRVNPMKTDRETLRKSLEAAGVEVEAGAYSRLALRVRGNLVPARIPEFADGQFFIQDESETLVVELLGPEEEETVLDLCAAPGGKACQIQESRSCRGRVLAVDVHGGRLRRVEENVERMGLSGIRCVQADGAELALAESVDRVLVDAPCSGLGVLARRADARWRKTRASIRALLPLQAALLEGGANHLRPGGTLVYSVCSIEPEEGIAQVRRFLEAHPDYEREDAGERLPEATIRDGCLFMLPHKHRTDGAFAARLRRKR